MKFLTLTFLIAFSSSSLASDFKLLGVSDWHIPDTPLLTTDYHGRYVSWAEIKEIGIADTAMATHYVLDLETMKLRKKSEVNIPNYLASSDAEGIDRNLVFVDLMSTNDFGTSTTRVGVPATDILSDEALNKIETRNTTSTDIAENILYSINFRPMDHSDYRIAKFSPELNLRDISNQTANYNPDTDCVNRDEITNLSNDMNTIENYIHQNARVKVRESEYTISLSRIKDNKCDGAGSWAVTVNGVTEPLNKYFEAISDIMCPDNLKLKAVYADMVITRDGTNNLKTKYAIVVLERSYSEGFETFTDHVIYRFPLTDE